MGPTTRNLLFSVAMGLVVLVIAAWGWEAPLDLRVILKGFAALALAASVIPSSIGFVRRADAEGWRAGLPLFLNGAVLMIWIAGPLEPSAIRLNFWSNYEKRMRAVELAKVGRLKERVALQDTSNYGEQLDSKGTSLRFKMTAGCMGGCWSGFVYVFNAEPPEPDTEETTLMHRKLEDHWYWVDVLQ
jgi:hypothetical protein